jgi:biopolymer transport protein ExbD
MRRNEARAAARRARPDINVTPFIDILLVLLIIFMVITPLKPARFKALIPGRPPESDAVEMSPRTLVVSIDRELRLTLISGRTTVAEGSVSDPGAVSARLAEEWRRRKSVGDWKPGMIARADLAPDERIERTVFVRAPRSVRYGEVAKVIDGIKGAGARPIGLQVDELPQ